MWRRHGPRRARSRAQRRAACCGSSTTRWTSARRSTSVRATSACRSSTGSGPSRSRPLRQLPPADRTERSMPAFLTGLRVGDARLVGRNQLRLQVEGRADPFVWSGADTIFAKVRALGVNTGLAGFFLPYCAMVGDSLTTCQWQPCVTCGRLTGVFGNSLGESMWHQASELGPQYGRRRHMAAFKTLQEASIAAGRGSVHRSCAAAPARCRTSPASTTAREVTSASARPPATGTPTTLRSPIGRSGELRAAVDARPVGQDDGDGVWRSRPAVACRWRVDCRPAGAVPGEAGRAVARRHRTPAPSTCCACTT